MVKADRKELESREGSNTTALAEKLNELQKESEKNER
jgi:hypothetical protein